MLSNLAAGLIIVGFTLLFELDKKLYEDELKKKEEEFENSYNEES